LPIRDGAVDLADARQLKRSAPQWREETKRHTSRLGMKRARMHAVDFEETLLRVPPHLFCPGRKFYVGLG
jgi:hypothetical protein